MWNEEKEKYVVSKPDHPNYSGGGNGSHDPTLLNPSVSVYLYICFELIYINWINLLTKNLYPQKNKNNY